MLLKGFSICPNSRLKHFHMGIQICISLSSTNFKADWYGLATEPPAIMFTINPIFYHSQFNGISGGHPIYLFVWIIMIDVIYTTLNVEMGIVTQLGSS
jgi:hypothetical protein